MILQAYHPGRLTAAAAVPQTAKDLKQHCGQSSFHYFCSGIVNPQFDHVQSAAWGSDMQKINTAEIHAKRWNSRTLTCFLSQQLSLGILESNSIGREITIPKHRERFKWQFQSLTFVLPKHSSQEMFNLLLFFFSFIRFSKSMNSPISHKYESGKMFRLIP